eukprot:scaffold327_cov257-Pinguiococcus_pyrenoidosus.AAC.35
MAPTKLRLLQKARLRCSEKTLYVVTRTSSLSRRKSDLALSTSSMVPIIARTLRLGQLTDISCTQKFTTDVGATTRNGPASLRANFRWARNEMTCKVFPRPISSPRMQLHRLSYMLIRKFIPTT